MKCLKGLFLHRTEPKQRFNIGGVEVGGRESPEVGRTLVEDCRIMTMAEVCLHGDKLDQNANSIHVYPQEWSVTLFPILEGGPIIWISGLLVPILPSCVSRPLKCKRRMDRKTFRIHGYIIAIHVLLSSK